MTSNEFKGTMIYTEEMMKKFLKPLQETPPEYMFIEKKIYLGKLSPQIYQYSFSLMSILNQILPNYAPYRDGEYLMALRRKK